MNISDILVGDEVFVKRSEPMAERGIVSRIVCNGVEKYVIVYINGREHRCRASWLTHTQPEVTDEEFDRWWEMGSDTETLFHWYAQNYHLVSLDGVVNSYHLSLAIKEAMYKQATGCKYEYKD